LYPLLHVKVSRKGKIKKAMGHSQANKLLILRLAAQAEAI
jgi:hypothetical protein